MKNHTVDVGRISKALNKFQFQQKPLSPIIWILVYILWPREKQPSALKYSSTGPTNPKIRLLLMKKEID